jgi:threonine/homoserine/homoserine lactone efflux protein
MFGIENYFFFIISGLILNITPGTDTLYILGRTISQGRAAGLVSILGSVTGQVIHTLFSAFGLSLILMKSIIIFSVIKWVGAGYLIFLGIRILVNKNPDGMSVERLEKVVLKKIYIQGLLTNLLNPKVALFFLAFLPQFIIVNNNYGTLPFLFLGLTFITTGTIWCVILVMFSERLTRKIRKSGISKYLNKMTGIIFIALGLKMLKISK